MYSARSSSEDKKTRSSAARPMCVCVCHYQPLGQRQVCHKGLPGLGEVGGGRELDGMCVGRQGRFIAIHFVLTIQRTFKRTSGAKCKELSVKKSGKM
jgi:hypothetical protein